MFCTLRFLPILFISYFVGAQNRSPVVEDLTNQFDTTYYKDIDSADSIINLALEHSEKTQKPIDLGHSYYRKGIIFDIQGKTDDAAKYLFKGIKQLKKTDDWRGLSAAYNNLSVYYFNIFEYKKVIEVCQKEIDLYDELGLNAEKASALNNMALAYKYLEQPKKALDIQLETLELFKQSGDKNGTQSAYANIGTSYFDLHEYGKALEYFKESEKISEAQSNKFNLITVYNSMGQTYMALEEFELAKEYLEKALEIAESYDSKERIQYIYQSLSDLAETKKDYKSALEYYKQFHALGNEVYQTERNDAMAKYEKKFEVFESREKQREAQLKVIERERTILYISIGTLVLLIVLSLLIYAVRMRNKAIRASKVELESRNRLMREMHHRIKNNLQLVESMLNIQSRRMNEDSAAQLEGVRGSIQAMAGIHEGLYSQGSGEHIDSKQFFSNLEENLKRSDQNEVNLTVHSDPFKTDIDTVVSIGIIVNELFTNSLKYAFKENDEKKIEVELQKEKDTLLLKYRDFGRGMSELEDNRSTSFGMKMINATLRKLKAEMKEEHSDKGVAYTFIIHRFQSY